MINKYLKDKAVQVVFIVIMLFGVLGVWYLAYGLANFDASLRGWTEIYDRRLAVIETSIDRLQKNDSDFRRQLDQVRSQK